MRLIDADALIAKAYIMQEPNGFIHSVVTERQITKAPTIDAVPVVRCKYCENWREHISGLYGKDYGYCRVCMMDTKKGHFCSYGERKDGDG